MGQKSNILTLRKVQKNLSFWETEKESKKIFIWFKILFFSRTTFKQKEYTVDK